MFLSILWNSKPSILHDVLLGLSYLHGQDKPIVHRDVSLNNILSTAHTIAKISDLGVAKISKAHTSAWYCGCYGTRDI